MHNESQILPIQRAEYIVGSRTELAKKIGVTAAAIGYWIKVRNGVPTNAAFCEAIEKATNGKVTAKELNPAMFK